MVHAIFPEAFTDAVRRLNRRNVEHLWRLAAILSAEEMSAELRGSRNYGFLFPALNLGKLNLFCKTILQSSASPYKRETLTGSEFVQIANLLNGSLGPEAPLGVVSADFPYEFLAAIGNAQFRYQGVSLAARAARAYAFYSAIPRDNADEIRRRAGRYMDFNATFETAYGLPIAELLEVMRRVAILVLAAHEQAIRPVVDEAASAWARHEQAGGTQNLQANRLISQSAVIQRLASLAETAPPPLSFGVLELTISAFRPLKPGTVTNALAILSRDTVGLRSQAERFPLNPRNLEGSVSALERYPIVRLADRGGQQSYIVPNVRWLYRAFTDIIPRLLKEAADDDQTYGETRGAVLEVYLERLLQDRIPQAVLIAERKYDRPGQGRVLGPDLVILDPRSESIAIIEAKAAQISERTLTTPRPKIVGGELKKTLRALSPDGAGRKLTDLRAGLPVYAREQGLIDRAAGPVVAIAVVADGSVFLEGLLARHVENSNSPLVTAPYSYGVLSLDDFEVAVEIAAAEGAPVQDILLEFARHSKTWEHDKAPPSHFDGHARAFRETFFSHYLEELFPSVVGD